MLRDEEKEENYNYSQGNEFFSNLVVLSEPIDFSTLPLLLSTL